MADDADLIRRAIPGYELLRPIGRGGMGVAYLAQQLSLGRRVVVKFLNRDPEHDPVEQATRFRREAELMARVSHPNIATIFDYGIDDGRPYLVMEYVAGGDLRGHLVPGRPLGAERVRQLLGPLVKGLACLHQYGILHLDLKPENILMAGENTPKVCDFGIAMPGGRLGAPAEPDKFLGTIGYVAPEQQYRLPVDERADQYSLAALCYELLTGQLPLGNFPLPSTENPRLQPSVDPVIMRALSEDRSDRFATIGEFGEALDQALAIAARRRRRPWFFTAAALLVLMVLLVGRSAKKGPAGRRVAVQKPPVRAIARNAIAATAERPLVTKRPQAERPPVTKRPQAEVRAVTALVTDRRPAEPPVTLKTAIPPPLRAPTLTADSLGIALVLIPEGTFLMGSPDLNPYARANEKPAHRVKVKHAFFLGAYEITVGQFRAFVDATGYRTKAERDGKGGAVYDRQRKQAIRKPELNWRNPGFQRPQAPDEPVVQVSWDDACEFCKWLSAIEGVSYRLPTELEWEYACRAGSQSSWYFGEDFRVLGDYAWFKKNAGASTQPVGRKQPNAFGLYDMYGNAWEWCKDPYVPYSQTDNGTDPSSSREKHRHVLRGGSWASEEPAEIRSANRRGDAESYRYYSCGFRVRRAVGPPVASLRSQ